jgi:hypothetical protein
MGIGYGAVDQATPEVPGAAHCDRLNGMSIA